MGNAEIIKEMRNSSIKLIGRIMEVTNISKVKDEGNYKIAVLGSEIIGV